MRIILNILLWIISLFSILFSFGLISDKDYIFIGIFFLILGLSLIPQIRTLINKKLTTILAHINKNNRNVSDKSFNRLIGIIKFTVFFIAFILIVINLPQPQITNSDTNDTPKKQEFVKNKYIDNPNTKKISKATKIDKKFASKVYKILVNCGVNDINWIEKIEDMNDAYFIYLNDISEPIKVSFKNNEIEYVFFDTWNLYKDGEYSGKLSDYSVTIDENMLLKSLSKDNINTILKYPKNSKYNETSWRITKFNNEYGVSCNVDIPNTFGMFTTHHFFLSYKKENENFILTSMECDGEKSIQTKQVQQKLIPEDKKSVEDINKALGL